MNQTELKLTETYLLLQLECWDQRLMPPHPAVLTDLTSTVKYYYLKLSDTKDVDVISIFPEREIEREIVIK